MRADRQTMLNGLCALLSPRHIVLAGGRDDTLARALLEAARRAGATLHIAAPRPREALLALRQEGGDACVIHDAPAEAALGILPVPGLCWVDADPNWHTVHGVLAALEAQAARLGRELPVTVIEGAGWPHGRRDGYDDPAAIPGAFRHPHERAGLLPGQAMPAGGGGLHADGYHATAENEPRNGVLTAVEDFIEGRSATHRFVVLPGFGGRVAVTPRGGPGAAAFSPAALAGYLRDTVEALEAVRLAQAAELAAAAAELARAAAVNALLRATPAPAPPAPDPSPSVSEPAWRRRLRPAVHLARRVVRGAPPEGETAAQEEARQAARLRASPIFDAAWYLDRNADVAAAAIDPALHYLRSGAAESRDPGPFFSTSLYLDANPDVAEAGINPVLHYLACGAAEGRHVGGRFDAPGYLARHPGLAERGETPLEHFIASRRAGASSDPA